MIEALFALAFGRYRRRRKFKTVFRGTVDSLAFDPRSHPPQIEKMRAMLHNPRTCGSLQCEQPLTLAREPMPEGWSWGDSFPMLDLHTGAIWETVEERP